MGSSSTGSPSGPSCGARCSSGRRAFLRRALLWTASLPAVGLLAACARGPSDQELAEQARRLSAGLDCSDTSGLQRAEALTRERNEYRERSDKPGQYCFNCDNYQQPAAAGRCASCKTVRGPINPGGWCTAWVPMRG